MEIASISAPIVGKGALKRGVERAICAAQAAGVKRFPLMSANGAKSDGMPYQRTKPQAEEALKASGFDVAALSYLT